MSLFWSDIEVGADGFTRLIVQWNLPILLALPGSNREQPFSLPDLDVFERQVAEFLHPEPGVAKRLDNGEVPCSLVNTAKGIFLSLARQTIEFGPSQ